jgi:Fic family protein
MEVWTLLQDTLKKIDYNRELLKKHSHLTEEEQKSVDRFYRIHNTYTSNAIEGNTFSALDTELWLEEGITVSGKTRHELREVDGHGDAFNLMLKIARGKNLEEISKDFLIITQELHEMLYKQIDLNFAGVYRKHNIIVHGAGFPTPKWKELFPLMDEFYSAFKEKKNNNIHPVELAAFAHLRLVQIHPFADGNGRTSRLLMNLILVNQGYQIINIRKQIRKEYYIALREADKQNYDSNSFFNFIASKQLSAQEYYMRLIQFEHQRPKKPESENVSPGFKP